MSGNIRNLSIGSMVVVGSVMVVHSLAASPEPVLDDPPLPTVAAKRVELEDAPLAEAIRRFATVARGSRVDDTR
jgi:hypothetical protein